MDLRLEEMTIIFRSRELTSLRDAMIGRRLRNTYRSYLGHDSYVGVLRQIWWWYAVYKPAQSRGEKCGWLFYANQHPVGYGGVSRERDRWWVTAGLVPQAWGLRLGRKMFAQITKHVHGLGDDAWLTVFEWNDRARRLYASLGYEYTGEVEQTPRGASLTMVCTRG